MGIEINRSNLEKVKGEVKEVINFGRAPAFFIPLPLLPSNEEDSLSRLEQNLELYNGLLNQGIPAFWRTFGINGYILREDQYQHLLNTGIEPIIGFPYGKNNSFVIKSKFISYPDQKFAVYNAGSSAVVAAYKGFSVLNQRGSIKGNVFRINNRKGIDVIYDHKGIPIEILSEGYLNGYFDNQSHFTEDVFRKLELPHISPNLELISIKSPFVLKIDMNNSTRQKLESGEWLELEWQYVSFSTRLLYELGDSLLELHFLDLMGESMVVICPSSELVARIYRALKNTASLFPDIDFTAVGTRLPEVTIFQSENGFPIYYGPYIDEKYFYPLEEIYKKECQGERGRPRRPGSFLISKNYSLNN